MCYIHKSLFQIFFDDLHDWLWMPLQKNFETLKFSHNIFRAFGRASFRKKDIDPNNVFKFMNAFTSGKNPTLGCLTLLGAI